MTRKERQELAAAQAREARQLVRYLANRAAEEHRNHARQAASAPGIALGLFIAYRTAAAVTAHHLKRHGLL